LVGFEIRIVGRDFDRGEVGVNGDLAGSRVERDDSWLGKGLASGC
jgi:hypothetical protein